MANIPSLMEATKLYFLEHQPDVCVLFFLSVCVCAHACLHVQFCALTSFLTCGALSRHLLTSSSPVQMDEVEGPRLRNVPEDAVSLAYSSNEPIDLEGQCVSVSTMRSCRKPPVLFCHDKTQTLDI